MKQKLTATEVINETFAELLRDNETKQRFMSILSSKKEQSKNRMEACRVKKKLKIFGINDAGFVTKLVTNQDRNVTNSVTIDRNVTKNVTGRNKFCYNVTEYVTGEQGNVTENVTPVTKFVTSQGRNVTESVTKDDNVTKIVTKNSKDNPEQSKNQANKARNKNCYKNSCRDFTQYIYTIDIDIIKRYYNHYNKEDASNEFKENVRYLENLYDRKSTKEKIAKMNSGKFSEKQLNFYTFICAMFETSIVQKLTASNFSKWIDTIDKMRRLDDLSSHQIASIVHYAVNDEFWSRNCKSVASLRKDRNGDGVKKHSMILSSMKRDKRKLKPGDSDISVGQTWLESNNQGARQGVNTFPAGHQMY